MSAIDEETGGCGRGRYRRHMPMTPQELYAHAVESLAHISRAHVSRWGDGGAHFHAFVIARPAGFPQLRGTCMALWDDLLPDIPLALRLADAAQVVSALVASYGGSAGAGLED